MQACTLHELVTGYHCEDLVYEVVGVLVADHLLVIDFCENAQDLAHVRPILT